MLRRSTRTSAVKEKSIELGDKQLLRNEEPASSYKRTFALVNTSTESLKEVSVTVRIGVESVELADNFNVDASVSEDLQSQGVQGKRPESTGRRKILRELKTVLDWDNGTGDFIGEDGQPLEKNYFNLRLLSHKIGIHHKTLEKYLHKDKSKRRVIGGGVGMQANLSIDDCDFSGQVAARRDRVNDGLARRDMVDLVL